jgi:2-phosphoglycerate kinase
MTSKPNKPPRMYLKDDKEEKIRYRKRTQEEQEAKRSLNDFLRHLKEEEDNAPPF